MNEGQHRLRRFELLTPPSAAFWKVVSWLKTQASPVSDVLEVGIAPEEINVAPVGWVVEYPPTSGLDNVLWGATGPIYVIQILCNPQQWSGAGLIENSHKQDKTLEFIQR